MQSEICLPESGPCIPQWQQLLSESGLLDQARHSFPTAQLSSIVTSSPTVVIKQALRSLAECEQVAEVRVLGVHGKKRTDSGYFNDCDKLAKAAAQYDGRAEGIYFTVNPVNPALIARSNNRMEEFAEHTTSDHDILKRITLPIDFDPVRPAGISSTNDEFTQHCSEPGLAEFGWGRKAGPSLCSPAAAMARN